MVLNPSAVHSSMSQAAQGSALIYMRLGNRRQNANIERYDRQVGRSGVRGVPAAVYCIDTPMQRLALAAWIHFCRRPRAWDYDSCERCSRTHRSASLARKLFKNIVHVRWRAGKRASNSWTKNGRVDGGRRLLRKSKSLSTALWKPVHCSFG